MLNSHSLVHGARHRLLTMGAIGVVAIVALTGCSTQATVLEGSTVTVALAAAPFSLNDHTSFGSTAANRAIREATHSSFARYGKNATLAEDHSFGSYQLLSNDPLTVKYTIADGVAWSDGVPVDAADLLLAWVANSGARNTDGIDDSTYRDAETGQYASPFAPDVVYFDGATSAGLNYVTTMPEISDDGRSLTLVWDRYVVDWPLLLDVGVPAHVVAARGLGLTLPAISLHGEGSEGRDRREAAQSAKDALVAAIIDNDTASLSALANFWNSGFNFEVMPDDDSILLSHGPYTLTGFVPGESVTLTANKRYTGAHSPVFEKVVVHILGDPIDQFAALAAGTVDVISPRLSSGTLTALRSLPDTTVLQVAGGTHEHLDLTFTRGKHSTFENPLVREAFLKTVPVDAIRKEVLGSPLAESSVRSSLVFFPDEPGYAESVTENGSVDFAQPDVAGAKSLLGEAGLTSPSVCILFDPSNPNRVVEFQLIAESARLAGFRITNCSSPDWLNLLGTPHTYDASLFAWTSSNKSVAGQLSIFGTEGRGNLNGYSNPDVDTALSRLAVTPDGEARQGIRMRLDAMLYADAYGLPLYQDQIVVAHNSSVTGPMPATLAGGILWNIWEWGPSEDSEVVPSPVK